MHIALATSSGHTPAPWSVTPYCDAIVSNQLNCCIALLGDAKENEANAYLIAAAPELLEAAERVIARWESGDLAEAMSLLSAAIGKSRCT